MKTIEKIRAEIERRIRELDEQIVDIYDSKAVLRKDELQRLLSFLSTLEEPSSDDLEEVADKYAEKLTSEPYLQIVHMTDFVAGAGWQKQYDDKEGE